MNTVLVIEDHVLYIFQLNCFILPGAPNDRFLSNAFKRCFRLSGILLKLCRLMLDCAKNI